MKKQINALIVKREDLKQELLTISNQVKEIGEQSGLFSASQNQLTPKSLDGMGAMMEIPKMLGKLLPLKAAIPSVKQGFSLLMQINEINEEIQDCLIMVAFSGGDNGNA